MCFGKQMCEARNDNHGGVLDRQCDRNIIPHNVSEKGEVQIVWARGEYIGDIVRFSPKTTFSRAGLITQYTVLIAFTYIRVAWLH